MRKKHILTKEQYNYLIESKKNERKILDTILGEVDRAKKGLNESTIITSAISDIIKKHHKKGNLTPYVVSRLADKGIKVK